MMSSRAKCVVPGRLLSPLLELASSGWVMQKPPHLPLLHPAAAFSGLPYAHVWQPFFSGNQPGQTDRPVQAAKV